MALDGKILARARKRLELIKADREAELARRTAQAYEKNPKIAEIDADIRSTVADAVGHALSRGADPYNAVIQVGEHNMELQEERRMELLVAGLPENWLDDTSCPYCHDTGRTRDGICSCLMELYAEEQKKELSALLKMGRDTFDNFDINLYSPEKDPATGVSPQENMEIVFELCVQYARRFGKHSMNLFLSGGPGLGKTFLSTCIAKEVSEKGFSVVYGTASDIFGKYEDMKFGRGDGDALRSDIFRMENCDLLILDDLGTEFATPLVTSALYTLLNTRLTAGRQTVISSNYAPAELLSRYSAAIISRLEGEFELLRFFGSDIRQLKK